MPQNAPSKAEYAKRTHGGLALTLFVVMCIAAVLVSTASAQEANATGSKPGPITIHLDATHPNDVLAEITKQTGVVFNIWPENIWEQYKHNTSGPPTAIDLNVDNKPFWVAMQEFCAASKLTPSNMGQGGISLQFSGGNSPFAKHPISVNDNATFVVENINRNHTINFGNQDEPQVNRNCGVQMSCYMDPRLRVTKYQNNLAVEKAEDENGKSILATAGGSSSQNPSSIWLMNGLFVPLDYDPQTSKKLALLSGTVRVTAATEVERLELDLATAEGTSKDIGGRTVTIDKVTDSNNQMDVKVTITRTDLPKEQFREINNNLFQAINLNDASGKRRNNSGGGGGSDDSITYSFQASYSKEEEKPVKLVWEVATKIEDLDLPFEFKDLPLP